jgi:hypothetical protein
MPGPEANQPDGSDDDQQGTLGESPLGNKFVGLVGAVAITAYLVLLTVFLLYSETALWPRVPPGQTGEPPFQPMQFLWWQPSIADDVRIFLITIAAGALGSLLHALRSVSWYLGNRKLVWSWAVTYMLLPFTGALLAAIFYIAVRGGFVPQSTLPSGTSPYAFAALGSLVGLFSQQAILKLKQVAETVFSKVEPGKDHVEPPPKVTSISPAEGPAAGGTPVTIAGANFSGGVDVTIGGTAATAVAFNSSTQITAKTPAHAAGIADVEVTSQDGQKGTLTGGYKYN